MASDTIKLEISCFRKLLLSITNDDEKFERIFVTAANGFPHIPISGVGVSFGELGILNKKPRGATLIAKDKVVCILILANDYTKILAQAEKEQQDKKIKFKIKSNLRRIKEFTYTIESRELRCILLGINSLVIRGLHNQNNQI